MSCFCPFSKLMFLPLYDHKNLPKTLSFPFSPSLLCVLFENVLDCFRIIKKSQQVNRLLKHMVVDMSPNSVTMV